MDMSVGRLDGKWLWAPRPSVESALLTAEMEDPCTSPPAAQPHKLLGSMNGPEHTASKQGLQGRKALEGFVLVSEAAKQQGGCTFSGAISNVQVCRCSNESVVQGDSAAMQEY